MEDLLNQVGSRMVVTTIYTLSPTLPQSLTAGNFRLQPPAMLHRSSETLYEPPPRPPPRKPHALPRRRRPHVRPHSAVRLLRTPLLPRPLPRLPRLVLRPRLHHPRPLSVPTSPPLRHLSP